MTSYRLEVKTSQIKFKGTLEQQCLNVLSCWPFEDFFSACYAGSDNDPKGSHYWTETTGIFQDQNIIEFGENMAGVENPIMTSFSSRPVCKQLIIAQGYVVYSDRLRLTGRILIVEEIFKILQNRVCMPQFSCRFAFLSTFLSFKPDTGNNANFDAVSSKRASFDECNFLIKHTPKLIIFGTHNLQTFKHNTLINKVLLVQFYLFNICPKLHHRKLRKLCITLFRTFSTSPAACRCCSLSNLYL